MNAIVSLLDDEHIHRVTELWDELERADAVRRVRELVPYPHVTYQGAEHYDLDRLKPILEQVARDTKPFTLQTAGLGIFSGPQPVLYISVVRSQPLSAFHRALWQAIDNAGSDLSPYYSPDGSWMPHITLAQWDISAANLPAIIGPLSERPFAWDILVDNLALLVRAPAGESYTLRRRFDFGAATSQR
jgi:2'-5' RNA ligase